MAWQEGHDVELFQKLTHLEKQVDKPEEPNTPEHVGVAEAGVGVGRMYTDFVIIASLEHTTSRCDGWIRIET